MFILLARAGFRVVGGRQRGSKARTIITDRIRFEYFSVDSRKRESSKKAYSPKLRVDRRSGAAVSSTEHRRGMIACAHRSSAAHVFLH
jgi:hypothetical protein